VKPDETRTVFEGRRITVVVERWDGSEREVVRHPGAVAIVAIDVGERVTLVRQRREAARKRVLELPAGTREPGEEPLATAKRELAEETGLVGGTWRLAATYFSTPGFCDEVVRLYVAEQVEQAEEHPDEGEELELIRVPVGEISERLAEIEDAKTLVGLLLYLAGR
jgi:ADP-ribose pyrophosphatase